MVLIAVPLACFIYVARAEPESRLLQKAGDLLALIGILSIITVPMGTIMILSYWYPPGYITSGGRVPDDWAAWAFAVLVASVIGPIMLARSGTR